MFYKIISTYMQETFCNKVQLNSWFGLFLQKCSDLAPKFFRTFWNFLFSLTFWHLLSNLAINKTKLKLSCVRVDEIFNVEFCWKQPPKLVTRNICFGCVHGSTFCFPNASIVMGGRKGKWGELCKICHKAFELRKNIVRLIDAIYHFYCATFVWLNQK